MNDDVGAVLDRPAEIGSGQRVVDDERNARRMGDLRDALDVDDNAAGVGEVLDEDRLALRRQALRKFSGSLGSTKWQVQPSFLNDRPNWVSEPP